MSKQVVFFVTTGADGGGEAAGSCKSRGGLVGNVKSIEYITDNRVPFEIKAVADFYVGDAKEPFATVNLEGRTEVLINGPQFKGEPVRCVVSDAGKGRSGAFVVTCS